MSIYPKLDILVLKIDDLRYKNKLQNCIKAVSDTFITLISTLHAYLSKILYCLLSAQYTAINFLKQTCLFSPFYKYASSHMHWRQFELNKRDQRFVNYSKLATITLASLQNMLTHTTHCSIATQFLIIRFITLFVLFVQIIYCFAT